MLSRIAIMRGHIFAMTVLMALAAAAIGIKADSLNLPEGFSHVVRVNGAASACETKILAHKATMYDCWLAVVSKAASGADVCDLYTGESCNIGNATKAFRGLAYEGFTLAEGTEASPSATIMMLLKSDRSRGGRDASYRSTDREYIKFPSGYRYGIYTYIPSFYIRQ